MNWKRLEIFLPVLVLLLHGLYYNTVAIRIHYLADIAGGILIAEAVYQGVLRPLETLGIY